jgi:hypothetical protein
MRSSNLWNGVVGFWSATAGPSGYRLLDRSGRGNHGTLTDMDAATDWVVDDGRYALDFDGVNDYVLTGWFRPAATSTSISIWIKKSAADFFFATDRTGGNGFGFEIYPSIVYVNINSGYGQFNFTTNNTWQHFLFSYNTNGSTNAERLQLFINGIQRSMSYPSAIPSAATASTEAFQIARRPWAPTVWGKGLFSESVVWNRPVYPAEAAQLYQIGRGGMLTPRRRRRAYFAGSGLRRRLLLTGQV